MSDLNFPASPAEGDLYPEVPNTDGRQWRFNQGAWRLIGSDSISEDIRLDRYDLAIAASVDGSGDVSKAQVFIIDNTVAGADKILSFTGAPVGRAMTVIVEVNGNKSTVIPDPTYGKGVDVDASLSATQTVYVFLYDGSNFKLMSVTRMS